jgi:hypothetical protein
MCAPSAQQKLRVRRSMQPCLQPTPDPSTLPACAGPIRTAC